MTGEAPWLTLPYFLIGPLPAVGLWGASLPLSSSEPSLSESFAGRESDLPFCGRARLRAREDRRRLPAPSPFSPPEATPEVSDSSSVPALDEELIDAALFFRGGCGKSVADCLFLARPSSDSKSTSSSYILIVG
jgi:hypothetical protein